MRISKSILFGIAGAALISATAIAHPHSKAEDGEKKEEKVKVYKFKGDDGEVKSTIRIKDLDLEGIDLESMFSGLEKLEGLESLKGLENLKGLSKLSDLSKLSELAELGEFNVETFDLDDGGTKIVIKRGKDGELGEHELHWDSKKMHKKHAELMDSHKKMMKKLHKHEDGKTRTVIKRLMGDDENDVTIWADSGEDGDHSNIFELDSGTRIFIDDEGDVKVMNEDDEVAVNVQKEVSIKNGKRKTRIVIEMESDED